MSWRRSCSPLAAPRRKQKFNLWPFLDPPYRKESLPSKSRVGVKLVQLVIQRLLAANMKLFFPASQEVRIWNIWLKPAHVIFSLSEMFSALRSVPTLGGRAFGFSFLTKGNAFSSAPASVCCNCQLNSELCFQCFQLMSCEPLFLGVGPWKTQPCCDSSTRLAGGHRHV